MWLQQTREILNRQARLIQDVREGRPFDGTVGWDHELQCLGRSALLQANVTASLPHNHSAASLKSMNKLLVGQAGLAAAWGQRDRE
jgi:hypothetical protein